VFIVVALVGTLVLNVQLKLFYQRPRPGFDWAEVWPETGFPSGHAMNSLVTYVALALVIWRVGGRRVGIVALVLAIVLAVGVDISRIYLGAHWLSDVIGGYLAGALWLLFLVAASGVVSRLLRSGRSTPRPGMERCCPNSPDPLGDVVGSGATTRRTLVRISNTTGVVPRYCASARAGSGCGLVMRTRLARSVSERPSYARRPKAILDR
jgi:hypothetical protein